MGKRGFYRKNVETNSKNNGSNILKNDIKKYHAGLIVAVLVLFLMNRVFGQVCLGKIFYGIPCPACGATRAFWYLLKMDIKSSIDMNPLLIPFIILIMIVAYLRYVKGNVYKIPLYVYFIFLIVTIVVYGFRMWIYFPDKEPYTYYDKNILNILHYLLYK